MKRDIENCNSPPRRRGFTLVEMLVVIAIIGLLVGLLLPAMASVRKKAKITAIKMEMTQLAAAIERVRTEIGGGQYPPDGTSPPDTLQFLKIAFPRCPATSYPSQLTSGSTFNPATALVFWLGGATDNTGAFIGLSANPLNPFDAGAARLPIFFDFGSSAPTVTTTTSTRFFLVGSVAGGTSTTVLWNLYQLYPPNSQPVANNAPYLYFKAVAAQYSSTPFQAQGPGSTTLPGTLPYGDSTAPATTTAFVNPKSYQLLCPGLDGKYGQYTTASKWPQYPSGVTNGTNSVAYDNVNGTDDMTNFTSGATVGDDSK